MSTILNEVFANFEKFENEQKSLEKIEVEENQFDLLRAEASLTEEPTQFLDNSVIVTADDKDVLSEKKFPFGLDTEDIVELAHPEPVVVADGPMASGAVDNQNTQQEKIKSMVNKQPTGNVFHNFSYASEIRELVAIAEELDAKGLYSEADALTYVAGELSQLKKKVATDFGNLEQQLNRLENAAGFGAASGTAATGVKGFLAKLWTWLGRGAAFLLTAKGAIIASVILGIPALISMYNGIQEEFNKDLIDLENAVQDLLNDTLEQPGVRLLSEMLSLIDQIKGHKAILDSGSGSAKEMGENIAKIGNLLRALRSNVNQFSASTGGILPDIVKDLFSSIRDRMSNLEESWQKFTGNVSNQATKIVQNSQSIDSEKDEDDRAKERSPSSSNKTHSPIANNMPEKPKRNKVEDVRSMQEFLLRIPNSFWDKAGFSEIEALERKGADGIMDGLTRAALDAFATYISEDLGVGNISGVRLEELGNGKKLREIWNIYRRPDLYMK